MSENQLTPIERLEMKQFVKNGMTEAKALLEIRCRRVMSAPATLSSHELGILHDAWIILQSDSNLSEIAGMFWYRAENGCEHSNGLYGSLGTLLDVGDVYSVEVQTLLRMMVQRLFKAALEKCEAMASHPAGKGRTSADTHESGPTLDIRTSAEYREPTDSESLLTTLRKMLGLPE